ncbi:MAG: 6,7-dimethyl-8-ribityllumazine synthase, partial [Pseudomonadota bacterium]|nr:6,7-dimethyl-8-ribityllumazine synthase [Pseudomonadota bacterium]
TTHYDIVCEESARGLMDLGVRDGLAIGNGIQTVENEQQAWARCNRSDKDKGGGAAKAALALLGLREEWQI